MQVTKPVDLTEVYLEDLIKQIRALNYRLFPDRFIVPPWVLKELEADYGKATVANYHKWNMKRLKLTEAKYWGIIGGA